MDMSGEDPCYLPHLGRTSQRSEFFDGLPQLLSEKRKFWVRDDGEVSLELFGVITGRTARALPESSILSGEGKMHHCWEVIPSGRK